VRGDPLPPQHGKPNGGSRAFEYIGAGTVSNVAPAVTSQRNSCEMSRRYKREQNSRGHSFSGGKTVQIFDDNSRDIVDEFSCAKIN